MVCLHFQRRSRSDRTSRSLDIEFLLWAFTKLFGQSVALRRKLRLGAFGLVRPVGGAKADESIAL